MSSEDVKFQKSKSIDIRKKQYRHFYVCMHHGSVWIHEFTLGMMFVTCSSIGMCELKYIMSFIIVLFIEPMKESC